MLETSGCSFFSFFFVPLLILLILLMLDVSFQVVGVTYSSPSDIRSDMILIGHLISYLVQLHCNFIYFIEPLFMQVI